MHHSYLQHDRNRKGAPQPGIDEQMMKSTCGFGAGVQHVEELAEDQHREADGARVIQTLHTPRKAHQASRDRC